MIRAENRLEAGRHIRRALLELAALTALGVLVVVTARALLVLFAGLLLAIILHGSSQWLSRRSHLPRAVVLTLLVSLGLGAFVLLLVSGWPRLLEQLAALRAAWPEMVDRAGQWLYESPLGGDTVSNLSSRAASNTALNSIGAALIHALGGSFEVLGSLVVLFFIGVYGAAQPEIYLRALLAITPSRYEARTRSAVNRARADLTRWMVGRSIAMLFVGVTTTIAFQLLSLPAAGLLGMLSGVLTFVEYAGAVISGVPPTLLALSHGPSSALAVLVLFTGLHIIEGYVLTPLLARAAVHLPPALGLGAQVLFGVLLGPLGLTFSTPLLVTCISAVKGWREPDGVRAAPGAA